MILAGDAQPCQAAKTEGMPSSYQIGLAAEAFAAGLFAHAGCEVLVQYGANQPLYDFVAVRGRGYLKVSVKGSQDGGWGLLQSFVQQADYHRAADLWLGATVR